MDLVFKTCIATAFLPLTRSGTDYQYCLSSCRRKYYVFNGLSLTYLMVWTYRLHICLSLLVKHEVKVETFICIGYFFMMFCPWVISLGVVLQPAETIDLINSWRKILRSMEAMTECSHTLDLFSDVGTCIKILSITSILPGTIISAAIVPLFFDSLLPATCIGTAGGLGFISEEMLKNYRVYCHLVFIPVEGLLTFWPVLMAVLSTNLVLLGLGVLKIAAEETRQVDMLNYA